VSPFVDEAGSCSGSASSANCGEFIDSGVRVESKRARPAFWRPNRVRLSLLFSIGAVCKCLIFTWGARGFKSRRPDQIGQRRRDNQPPQGGVLESIWSPHGRHPARHTSHYSLINASGLRQKRSHRDHGASLAEPRLLLDEVGLPTCPAPKNTCLDATHSNRGSKPSQPEEPC
jgi:hypothetical protein